MAPGPSRNLKGASSTAPVDLTLSSDDEPARKPKSTGKSSNGKAERPTASTSKPKASTSKAASSRTVREPQSSSSEDEPKSKPKAKAKAKAKRVVDSDDDDSDDEPAPPKKKARATPPSKPKPKAKPSSKREASSSSDSEAAPVKPKKPPAKKVKAEDGEAKPKWVPPVKTGPANPGSKEIPEGEPDCLGGLAFVFTGELDSLSRDEAQDLVKRYGGRTTTAPSSKTSYVVLGRDAGPSKLKKIKELGLQTLDEDGLLALIGSRGAGEVDERVLEKREKEAKAIKKASKELAKTAKPDDSALWTTKYAPTALKDVCGNKGQVEKIQKWLQNWEKSRKSGFKKGGPDATGLSRALLLSGPPGIGKTTAAHLCATLEGFNVLELNASDVRSKKLLTAAMSDTINNTDLHGFFTSDKLEPGAPALTPKTCLIMDEVDGMSAGDRGGIGALNMLIKKTKIPIICIANDNKSQKMKPLQNTTHAIPFKRPEAKMVRARILTIAHREGLKLPGEVVDQLVNGTQSDIRQVINMLSTWKLSQNAMNFDEGKKLSVESAKNMLQTPFTIMDKMFHPSAFGVSNRSTLTDRLELYFHDFSIIPLFVQENYAKFKFTRASGTSGVDAQLKQLELMRKASEAISDGDLVDRMIHGSQQQWSLLPVHGVFSTVRPAYFCHGMGSFGGQGSMNTRAFPSWLGKNSNQGRLTRELQACQIRMRLAVSGSKSEIRLSYMPALVPKLTSALLEKAAAGIDETIEVMDAYYLTREQYDTILELKVGDPSGPDIIKSVPTVAKSAFTREFTKRSHPLPFVSGADIPKPSKRMDGGDVPDIEDAIIDDVEQVDDDDEDGEEAVGAAKKGKGTAVVKAVKPKAARKAPAKK